MANMVGVIGWYGGSIRGTLKRATLMFDQIAVRHQHSQTECKRHGETVDGRETLRDLEFLGDHEVVVEGPEIVTSAEDAPWLAKHADVVQHYQTLVGSNPGRALRGELARLVGANVDRVSWADGLMQKDLYARLAATQLREAEGVDAIPIVDALRLPKAFDTVERTEVVQVVMRKLPMPSPYTPWEAILDYRADAEARTRYLQIRSWMNSIGRRELMRHEFEDEFASKLADFDLYMSVQHKKIMRGRLETFVVGVAQALESLARLKFSSLARTMFGVAGGKEDILEAELKAPGREVAYIHHTVRAFESP